MRLPIFIYIFTLISFPLCVSAQQAKDTPRLKPPKMELFWGSMKGGKINIDIAHQLLDSIIYVIAEKKEKLTISRAIFVYRSKDAIQDEETGAVKFRYNTSSYNFNNENSLPKNWRQFLKENIKPGDQIHIADIIVRDKRKNHFNAGDIKFSIE